MDTEWEGGEPSRGDLVDKAEFRPRVAVDWDGTCVPSAWPEQPTQWLPGAKKALRALQELGYEIVIYSCRVAPFAFPSASNPQDDVVRDCDETDREVEYIQRMLLDAGIEAEVWTRPYKPPAVLYIDDRAHHFDGDWKKAVKAVVNS